MKTIPENLRRWLLGMLGVGVAGDLLLRVTPWGFNLVIWVVLLAALVLVLLRTERQTMNRNQFIWFSVATAFSLMYGWRDSGGLQLLNTLSMLGAVGFAFWLAGIGRVNVGGLIITGLRLVGGIVLPLIGTFHVIGSWLTPVATNESGKETFSWTRFFRAILGLIITIPVILLFGSLFASADSGFKEVIRKLTDFDMSNVATHVLLISLFGWVAGGVMYWLWPRAVKSDSMEPSSPQLLGSIEIGTMLGALNLLFLLFIGVQVSYLFGGDAMVQKTANLSYAEYFRSGFFELLTVAALVLPLLLFCDWLWKDEESPKRFHQLATCLLVQLGVVMLSAFKRLGLYLEAYGLTEQRLYAAAVLCWLGFAAVWLGVTVLRGKRLLFAPGIVTAAFAVIFALNVINPDALIAKHQLSRKEAGRNWDLQYLLRLSADAAPVLVGQLDKFTKAEQEQILGRVVNQWTHGTEDWRTSNWSRWQAAAWREKNQSLVQNIPVQTDTRNGWEKMDYSWSR
jgi:hypothetical protein